MLKLNASYMKKVPVDGQDYSSQSYHCSMEVEISDGLTAEQIQARIHETFGMVRDSVEAELHNGNSSGAQTPQPQPVATPAPAPAPAATQQTPPTNRSEPGASPKQIKFVTDLALQKSMDLRTLNAEALRLFNVPTVEKLSRKQASELIERLNGGARQQQRRAA